MRIRPQGSGISVPERIQLVSIESIVPPIVVSWQNLPDHVRQAIGILSPGFAIGLGIFVRHDVRPVGRIGWKVAEEGLFLFCRLLHPGHRLFKPDIGAVAIVPLQFAVVPKEIVVVVVVPPVASGAYRSVRVYDHFVESSILWPEWIMPTQVPLSEDPGFVTIF